MTEHQARAEELLADYRRSRERLAEAQRELAAVRASASSPDGLVTATVSARGALTGLEISGRAYERYRPSELATQIVRVTAEATTEALADAGRVLAPALGPGTDPTAVVLGTGDLTAGELTAESTAADSTAAGSTAAGAAGAARRGSARPRPGGVRRTGEANTDDAGDFADQNWLDDGQRPGRR